MLDPQLRLSLMIAGFIRPRCAISLGKSIVVAYSNSRSPREYEFATDTPSPGQTTPTVRDREP